jgi:leader peptidase (prepilin peptidase)/N-methyltransferase
MTAPAVVLLGMFGLVVGSFLNVCIYRLPRGESIAFPASHCTACGRGLSWYENVPVLGWLALRGRCRTCGESISWMYPAVELATPALFLLQHWYLGWQPLLAVRLLFTCAMIVLFVIDLQHRVLPNVITLPGVGVGLAASLVIEPGWRDALIGVVVGGGVLLLVAEAYLRLRGKEGLGMGDVKMLAMIGAFLGWQLMLLTLLFASVVGSVIGIGMMIARVGDTRYALPLGTFLAIASIVVTVVGEPFVTWYVSFY